MIVVLSGGVGGARMARGMARVVPAGELTIIVNTGDDFEHLGLAISPDLDTVMYTLARLEDPVQGWGLAGETWAFMDALGRIGGETWFRLGDRDLATHVERTRRLAAGASLSRVTQVLCTANGIGARVLPMTDDRVRTMVESDHGTLSFQDYFVRLKCAPRVREIRFEGASWARPAPGCIEAITNPLLEAIVLAPSNPFVSVAPLFAVSQIEAALAARRAPLIAVSPIVGGKAVKGPAAKMMEELGLDVSALGIARHYRGLIDGLVIDAADSECAGAISALAMAVHVTDTIMKDDAERARLAGDVRAFARRIAGNCRWRSRPAAS
jgi:LPPG:FO 2-phospho-L-lactate transferase